MTESPHTIRAHMFVSGRVQGVGFRAFVGRQAQHHGLIGWVRNVLDGRVELEVQGGRPAIDSFLQDLDRGPTWSNVEQVKVDWIEPENHETGFEIMY